MRTLQTWLADRSLAAKGLCLVLIPLGPLVLTSSLIYVVERFQRDAAAAVTRTLRVETDLNALLSLVGDAEAAQRGYLLTGDEGWLQAGRWDDWSSAILPTITLGAAPAAYLAALLRSTLIETLGEDFVRTARAKGLKESLVVMKHALAHSLIPVLTVMGPLAAALLTGSFVVEYVFAIPGMGRFFISAVTDRDYPLIMGVTLVYTVLLVCANLVVDMLYGYADPRIRAQS